MKLVVTLASLFALLNIASGSIPSAPINVTTDGIGSRSINISWTRPAEDGNSSQLAYAVFYKGTGDEALKVLEVLGDTKATIPAKPYRRYDIYVMANNKDGYGPPTSKKRETTLEEEPEKCPKLSYTAERKGPNQTNLEIGWEKVPEEYQNGIIKGYVIFYISKSMTSIKNVTVNDSHTFEVMHEFKNISKDENYGFRVAAFTSVGLCKGYENIPWNHEFPPTTVSITSAPATTKSEPTTVSITSAPATTTSAPTTVSITSAPATTTVSITPATKTSAPTQVEETTTKPKEPTKGTTTQPPSEGGSKTEVPTPGERLARTSESNWLVYVLIAMAVIVAIMGVTIFLLIWQLYKNHRFYKLRKEQYRMNPARPNLGTDNEAQDNAV